VSGGAHFGLKKPCHLSMVLVLPLPELGLTSFGLTGLRRKPQKASWLRPLSSAYDANVFLSSKLDKPTSKTRILTLLKAEGQIQRRLKIVARLG
jgi:hypothetical protein